MRGHRIKNNLDSTRHSVKSFSSVTQCINRRSFISDLIKLYLKTCIFPMIFFYFVFLFAKRKTLPTHYKKKLSEQFFEPAQSKHAANP
jgi:hypothetical protein